MDAPDVPVSSQTPDSYEPPSIEKVLTSEDLTQETLYGGGPSTTDLANF
jgi:hypothetical protein